MPVYHDMKTSILYYIKSVIYSIPTRMNDPDLEVSIPGNVISGYYAFSFQGSV